MEGMEASVADVMPGGAETGLVEEPITQDVSEGSEQVSETPEQEGAEQPNAQQEPVEDSGDGRVLSPELRSHLKALKATNPKLEKSIRGAFFALDSLKKEYPGGTREAIELKQSLGEMGGLDGIKQVQADSQFYREVDEKIEKGDPSFVDAMGDMLPAEAFPAIASRFFATFGTKDPEGYQRVMSGVIASTFEQAGVQHHLARISDAIEFGKPEKAMEIIQALTGWIGEFSKTANTKPTPKQVDPQQAELTRRTQELDQRETQQFTNSVSSDVGTWSHGRVKTEVEPFLKGRKLNDEQFSALETRSLNKVRTALMSDNQFKKSYQDFFAAKDRDGLLKLVKAGTDKLLPAAVKESYRFLFSDFSAKKTETAPANGKPLVAAPQGWVKVSGPPQPDQIDNKKTPFGWKMRSAAFDRTGRKIYWGERPPA